MLFRILIRNQLPPTAASSAERSAHVDSAAAAHSHLPAALLQAFQCSPLINSGRHQRTIVAAVATAKCSTSKSSLTLVQAPAAYTVTAVITGAITAARPYCACAPDG
ncbi:hypothetical protein V5799_016642 [Amblyomma americanum]|uniref:Uncharacterized protein n=1 Tax=Amblyomma americanum TaxID=6943 RepID=A0AAQ4F5S8_AMBAM